MSTSERRDVVQCQLSCGGFIMSETSILVKGQVCGFYYLPEISQELDKYVKVGLPKDFGDGKIVRVFAQPTWVRRQV